LNAEDIRGLLPGETGVNLLLADVEPIVKLRKRTFGRTR